jgi:hypothetical protein
MRSKFHRLANPPARRRGRTTAAAVVVAALVAASLAGCGGDPEPTPTPTPSATPTPTPTPTPSPTVPVPAEYDPDWTQDQLDVVHLVEAFDRLDDAMHKDPRNWGDWTKTEDVAADPMLFRWRTGIREFQVSGKRWSEEAETIHVEWWVEPARDVDGRQEINLSWCETLPSFKVFEADGQVTEINPGRVLVDGTAQLIPNVGWRLIKTEGGYDPC